MAHGTVLILRRSQIVKRRRHHADGSRRVGRRQIRVTLQANIADVLPRQHSRIRGAVRLMARRAALETHGPVFERERTALVSVAVEATRLVGSERLGHHVADTSVRIVTIDAAHRALGQLMMIRSLELRPHAHVTTCALLVDRGGRASHQAVPSVRMNLVATCASHLIPGVTALQTANLGGCVQVTGQTQLVRRLGRQIQGIGDFGRIGGFGMRRARTMAGLAGAAFKATSPVGLYNAVRTLGEGLGDVLVANGTGVHSGIAGRKRWLRCRGLSPCREGSQRQTPQQQSCASIAHAPGRPRTLRWRCDRLRRLRPARLYSKGREKPTGYPRDSRYKRT
jgi:hypothetical protein